MNVVIIDKHAIQRSGFEKIVSEHKEKLVVHGVPGVPDPGKGDIPAGDVIILSLSQTDSQEDNLRELKSTCNCYPASRIFVVENVSSNEPFANLITYLKSGAHGYVTSRDNLEIFEEGLNKLLSGYTYLAPEALRWLLSKVIVKEPRQSGARLTANELTVAKQLIKGHSVTQIARETNRTTSTISTIKRAVFRKTGADNIVKLNEVLNIDEKRFAKG